MLNSIISLVIYFILASVHNEIKIIYRYCVSIFIHSSNSVRIIEDKMLR